MIRLDSAITVSLKADYTAEYVRTVTVNTLQSSGQVMTNDIRNIYLCFFYLRIYLYIL